MKKHVLKSVLIAMLFAIGGSSNIANAQVLFKDINPGAGHSSPADFITVNGSMYFVTNSNYVHAIWKSDGAVANTTLLMDNLITTNVGGIIEMIDVNGTLYFTVNLDGSSSTATKTVLWKSDGTPAGTVVIDTLKNGNPGSNSGFPPRNMTAVGNKLFFQMNKTGYVPKLWMSDGTKAGTVVVPSTAMGTNGSASGPMISFSGKLYFSGSTDGIVFQLYSSDGTDAGTTLVSPFYEPNNWAIYNANLYFSAMDVWSTPISLCKTDGITTTKVFQNTQDCNAKIVFKNAIYFVNGIDLWKSDGTTGGTVFVTDSAQYFIGANNDYLFSRYLKGLAVPPYYKYIDRKTDGNTAAIVSDYLGTRTSFSVLNNKMYSSSSGTGLSVSDGTDVGTSQLITTNTVGPPFVFNGTVFFSNYESSTGTELWSLTPTISGIDDLFNFNSSVKAYPNPSNGIINIISSTVFSEIKIYNSLGETIYVRKNNSSITEIDLTGQPKGIYFYYLKDNSQAGKTGKIIID